MKHAAENLVFVTEICSLKKKKTDFHPSKLEILVFPSLFFFAESGLVFIVPRIFLYFLFRKTERHLEGHLLAENIFRDTANTST